jgi:hypothetical protein
MGLAIILAFGACQSSTIPTASPAPSQTSPVASPGTPTPTPSTTPIGLQPITPTSDRAIVRLEIGGDIGPGPRLAVVLYDDGSLLDLQPRPSPTVTPLTRAGVTMVVDRLRASGLFTSSRAIPFTPLPMGFTEFLITLADGPEPIRVSANNQGDNPETRALIKLADDLQNPGSWLPAAAFPNGRAESLPYLPRQVRVTSETIPLGPRDWTNAAQSIHRVTWPLAVPPDMLGDPVALDGGGRNLRCGLIDGAEEAAIRAALGAFERDSPDGTDRTSGWYIWLPEPALLRLTLHAFLPDEAAGCLAADLPGPPVLAHAPRHSLFALLSMSAGGLTPAGSLTLFVQTVRQSDGATLGHVAYFADGTVLFADPAEPALGIGARRLSSVGLGQVQTAIDGSGLLRASYSEPEPDNAKPAQMYSIVTDSVTLNGTDRGTDPKAGRIVRLARQLLDPASWLPPTAWASDPTTVEPYRPASVHLQMYRQGGFPDPIPPLTALAWPLGGSVETFGRPDDTLPGMDARFADLSVDDAIAVLRALAAIGAPVSGTVARAEYVLGAGEPGDAIHFEFWVEAGNSFDGQ